MTVSLLGLVALVSLVFVLAHRYRSGRQHPPSSNDDPTRYGTDPGVSTVSVYGQECPAVRTAGDGIYVTGDDVMLMEGDTIRLGGRCFTITEMRRTDRGRDGGVLIVGLSELP